MPTVKVDDFKICVSERSIFYPTYMLRLGERGLSTRFTVETPFKFESARHDKEFVLYEEGRANMEALVQMVAENLTACLLHPNPRIRTIAHDIKWLQREESTGISVHEGLDGE